MGEIAEGMLDGTFCEGCGVYIGQDSGYPMYCSRKCAEDRGADPSQVADEDDDESAMWAEHKAERAEKKRQNHQRSIQLLKDRGIQFQTMNEGNGHYRLGEWDFWASTGKFINRKTKQQGRGVFNLIKVIENCPH